MRISFFLIIALFISLTTNAQYSFSGHIDKTIWQENVYLSLVDDYRKTSGIYPEQIISKIKTDSLGYFEFTGNQLELENRIYKIHVDNCFEGKEYKNHFNSHCNNSKSILFIAKNNDTINFPFSFDKQVFCDIKSKNNKTTACIKIDSLKEDMAYAYASYRSETNRNLNNKKWFNKLQHFGKQINEPLAELYIYAYLSDRSSDLHKFYFKDLKDNLYYQNLLLRLKEKYPNTDYTKQYEAELAADKYIALNQKKESIFNWNILLIMLLLGSVLLNTWFGFKFFNIKNHNLIKTKEQLTKQEQNILNLILKHKTNKEIAQDLFVSISTVKTHVNNIFKKLKVQSREEAKRIFNK